MAFQQISNDKAEFKSFMDLKVGESVTGYVTKVTLNTTSKFPDSWTIFIKTGNELHGYSAVGNLKYLAKDGKLALGTMTRFTRQADVKPTGKQKRSDFKVEIDPADTIAGYSVGTMAAVPAARTTANIGDKIKSLKGDENAS